MTNVICNESATGPMAALDPENLTELVRGEDQRLVDRVTPLVRRQSVALDLSSVERIDAAGIAALISLYRAACEAGHCFTVSHASPRVTEILALVGLDRILLSEAVVQAPYLRSQPERPAA